VNTLTYRLPWLRVITAACSRPSPAAGRSAAEIATSRARFHGNGQSSIGNRRADYTGAEIDIDGNELRWFNTAAFTNPPDDRAGTATVGQIEGPSFKQMDISMRKNFRFGGRYNITPIIDVFNLFDTVNFANFAGSSLDANNAVRHADVGAAVAQLPVRRPLRLLVADADTWPGIEEPYRAGRRDTALVV
jgi:hypothetical protein